MKKPHVLVKPALVLALTLALTAAHAQTAEAERAEPLFDVYEYVIEGNSLLPDAVVERTVAPYMGPGRRFADIEGARAALEKAYQEAGYLSVLVSLPNQRVDAGEVTLSVTEAPVDRLRVVSNTGMNFRIHPDTGALVDARPDLDGTQLDGVPAAVRSAAGDAAGGDAGVVASPSPASATGSAGGAGRAGIGMLRSRTSGVSVRRPGAAGVGTATCGSARGRMGVGTSRWPTSGVSSSTARATARSARPVVCTMSCGWRAGLTSSFV